MRRAFLLAAFLLTACGGTPHTPVYYLSNHNIPIPTLEKFPHCRGYGCTKIEPIGLNKKEWTTVRTDLPGNTAENERSKIAKSIGAFERTVGPIAKTNKDVAGSYIQPGPYQHDCVDESVNSTIYLMLMDQNDWLKFHEVLAPTSRMFFSLPHSTAVIRDKATGERYAVDSWFHDNGADAEIIPLSTWKRRWHPEDSEIPPAKPDDPKKADR
jgi:hypothetical protein